MPFGMLLVVGIVALILGYIEFKLHPLVGVATQIFSLLVLVAVFIGAVGYGGGFLAFFTMNTFLTYVTVIALGLVIGNAVAELVG